LEASEFGFKRGCAAPQVVLVGGVLRDEGGVLRDEGGGRGLEAARVAVA
jgi:hypothetical protein